MRLLRRLEKGMCYALISTFVIVGMPVMASDYDNHWAEKVIDEWRDYGIVSGYGEDIFKPNKEITRAELAVFISRVFGLKDTKGANKFTDVEDATWYAEDIARVSAAGVMQGADGKFNPMSFATREEVAVTLVNAFKLEGGNDTIPFSDESKISDWAKESVEVLSSNGYTHGRLYNMFAPKANITRAEFIVLLDNIIELFMYRECTYINNVTGNVIISNKNIVLENLKIDGNVYLAQGIDLDDIKLNNVEITGQIFKVNDVVVDSEESVKEDIDIDINIEPVQDDEYIVIPISGVASSDRTIMIDKNSIQNILTSRVMGCEITLGNVKEGEKITAICKIPFLGEVTISDTVEPGSKISYSTSDILEKFNKVKEKFSNTLKQTGYYNQTELVLNRFDLSMENEYLTDGDISIGTLYSKLNEIQEYLEDNKDNEKYKFINEQFKMELNRCGIKIDNENNIITGKLMIKIGELDEVEHTIIIKY